eukprot:gene5605-5123_t
MHKEWEQKKNGDRLKSEIGKQGEWISKEGLVRKGVEDG